jgi:hypothetical protein
LIIQRVLVIEQSTDLENQGGYFADVQETALDRLTMIDLQQQEEIDRAVKVPVGSDQTPEEFIEALETSINDAVAEAEDYADAASASADDASTSESNASTFATNASNSATASSNSADEAAASAQEVEDAKLVWQGNWDSGTAYVVNDAVNNDGSSYICILGHTNQEPPNATYWDVLALQGAAGAGTGDMLAANNLSDVNSAATSFANIKQSATTTATGVVELATDGETQTGTDAVRAVTPAGLASVGYITDVVDDTSPTLGGDLDADDNSIINTVRDIVTVGGTTDTLALTDRDRYIRYTSGSAVTVTVPANATVAFPVGTEIHLRQAGAGQVTVAAAGGVTINTSETLLLRTQHATVTLIKVGTNEWDIMGELEAA